MTPFPAGGARHAVSLDGGDEPVWSPEGRHIYYARGRQIIAAAVSFVPTFTVSRQVLFEGRYAFSYLHHNFDIAPDGRSFLMLKSLSDTRLVVVRDWFVGLRAR